MPMDILRKPAGYNSASGTEIFILEVYHNGSTIALFRPNYSNPHFEVYLDNENYTYVMRMSKLLNGILKDEIGGFPDFKFLNMYNLY